MSRRGGAGSQGGGDHDDEAREDRGRMGPAISGHHRREQHRDGGPQRERARRDAQRAGLSAPRDGARAHGVMILGCGRS
jgi:hypothetical protein